MTTKYYVTVYSVGQCYGGPEEGGWWYDAGTPESVHGPFEDNKSAQACADDLRERVKPADEYHMGHGAHDGADPDGNGDDAYLLTGGRWGQDRIEIEVDTLPGQPFPTERPFYE